MDKYLNVILENSLFKTEYYLFRFFSIYFSVAIVIEGVSGVGALISILKPAASEASIVEFP